MTTTDDDDFDGDPHPAWARKWDAFNKVFEIRVGFEDDELDLLCGRKDELMERIAGTPARTLAGVREQVRLVLVNYQRGQADLREAEALALETAVATLDQMLAIERRQEKQRQQRQRLIVPQEERS